MTAARADTILGALRAGRRAPRRNLPRVLFGSATWPPPGWVREQYGTRRPDAEPWPSYAPAATLADY